MRPPADSFLSPSFQRYARDKPLSEIENRSGYCSQNPRRDRQIPVSNNTFTAALNESFTPYLSPIGTNTKVPIAVTTPLKSLTVTSSIKSLTVRRHKTLVANTSFMAPPLVLVFPVAGENVDCKRPPFPATSCNSPIRCNREQTNALQFPPALAIDNETASTLSILRSLDRWHASTATSLQKRLISVQSSGEGALERFQWKTDMKSNCNGLFSCAAESATEEAHTDSRAVEFSTIDPAAVVGSKRQRPSNPDVMGASTHSSRRFI
jgi:hypothetical protein